MKILFLTENFPPETNAAATRVFERALYWVKDGHKVTVITSAPNFPQGKLRAGWENRWHQTEIREGIRVVRVKTYIAANRGMARRTLDFVSFMVTAFIAGLFVKRPDVIAATSPQFFAAVCGWALGGVRRIPFVFELGDLWPASIVAVGAMRPSLFLSLMEKLELFLYRRSAAVAALTHAFKKNLIERGIPADKIAVVINGVDLWRYAPQPKEMMPKVWSLCDVALVHLKDTAAFAEVIPSKMFEAMGMGLPVLMALPKGEASDILAYDRAGLHIPAEDPAALADAARQLCDDDALMENLSEHSLAAAPRHSRATQAQQMLNVLSAAADGKGAQAGTENR